MRPGEWYELPEGRIVRVVEVSGDPEMVLAEGSSGGAVERPVANARIRWSRLPGDGLAVRLATMPGVVQQLVEKDPVGLAILAIKDLGGSGSTAEIKQRLQLAIAGEDLDRWWKRNQPKLSKDQRIDNVDALSKRYRLVAPGLDKPQRVRDIRSGATRAGRQLLDGPTLKSARERAKRRLKLGEPPPTDLTDIASLVDDMTIDATDRFMAGEIGVFVGAFTEAELGQRLGSDATEINLLRVLDHQSRDRAIGLCEHALIGRAGERPAALWPTVASAIALGEQWSVRGLRIARDAGVGTRSALAGGIGWATPGSPEAGEIDHPKDLQQYLARVARLASLLDAAGVEGVEDQAVSALASMESLSTLNQKGDLWRNCIIALAEVLWDVPASGFGAVREAIQVHPPNDSETWRAIVSETPSEELPRLESLLESAAVTAPASIRALEIFAGRRDRDLAAWLVHIARKEIRASVFRVVLAAMGQPSDAGARHSESVTLGGTIWPDHSAVSTELDKMEQEVRNSLVSGDISVSGPVLLRADAWPRVVGAVHRIVADALEQRDEAVAIRTELEQRLETQAAQLESRRSALQAAKTEQTQAGSVSTQRLAANLLKPVAGALDDSYEARSLNSLQDQIRAAFGRLKVQPLATPGEIMPFDPDRQTWTGDGYPPPQVKVLTPGFAAQLDGGEVLVLAFARVGPVEG